MKRAVILSLALIFLCGCVHYSTTQGRSGIFNTVKAEGNLLDRSIWFDFEKRTYGADTFITVWITRSSSVDSFRFAKKDGVSVTLDGVTTFYLPYRQRPQHIMNVTTSGGGGTWMPTGGGFGMGGGMMYVGGAPAVTTVSYTDRALCFITNRQMAAMLKAGSIKVTVTGAGEFNFGVENFDHMRRFYNEEVAGMAVVK